MGTLDTQPVREDTISTHDPALNTSCGERKKQVFDPQIISQATMMAVLGIALQELHEFIITNRKYTQHFINPRRPLT
jgi:hypothetical protein